MTIDIAVIDYGMGNLRSVSKAIEHVAPGRKVVVTSNPEEVAAAGRVVFPGQGAMPDCMRELQSRNLRAAVLEAAASRPFLGICIGLQMLFEHSEEGDTPGLGLLPGVVRRFPQARMVGAKGEKLKVPHMGWNEVEQAIQHPMWAGIPDRSRFYFVHSYYPEPPVGAPILSVLPARRRAAICSRCSSIRRKATRPDCNCWQTLWRGNRRRCSIIPTIPMHLQMTP